ncbi:MAG: M23 family metallopeptidase [Verrucomicrobiota bacterium]
MTEAVRRRLWVLAFWFGWMPVAVCAQRIELAWPTPNRAFLEGRPIGDFVQPTVSGEVTSGLFGCVRSHGRQFHEGLDLSPVSRDRRGEATDPIYAVMSGVVRHVSRTAGDSSYGRYVVIEHPEITPTIYTLYAHLAAIPAELREGRRRQARAGDRHHGAQRRRLLDPEGPRAPAL